VVRRLQALKRGLARVPWWLALLVGLGVALIAAWGRDYHVIFDAVASGLAVTVGVTLAAFALSLVFGLGLALLRQSSWRPLREAATFYIELVRGLPMLVILYYIAFVAAPALTGALNAVLAPVIQLGWMQPIQTRDLDFGTRAVLALTLAYSAFLAEIFRAGIESVDRGQTEAAQALGLSRGQTTVFVVLPQAVRNVLPAMANEFISIVKDSSLVSVLGVQDITQLGKVYSASTFRFFETYNVVAFFYLCLTVSLSLLVRRLEGRLKRRS